MIHSGDQENEFWKTLFESKAEPAHFGNSKGLGLGLGTKSESMLMLGCPLQ